MRHDKLDGTHPTEEAQVSRRSLLLGLVATGAFAVPLLSTSTQAAVSMLRSGIDPDAVESEIIPAGKRVVAKEEAARDTGVGTRDVVAVRAMGARDMGVDIGGTATARAAVAFTTTPIMGAVVRPRPLLRRIWLGLLQSLVPPSLLVSLRWLVLKRCFPANLFSLHPRQ